MPQLDTVTLFNNISNVELPDAERDSRYRVRPRPPGPRPVTVLATARTQAC